MPARRRRASSMSCARVMSSRSASGLVAMLSADTAGSLPLVQSEPRPIGFPNQHHRIRGRTGRPYCRC
jgi:hypothetical protein